MASRLIGFTQPINAPLPALQSGNKPIATIQPTKARVVDRIVFSYGSIQPTFDRMKKSGLQIVEPISLRPEFGFPSFFVQGPENVLIEIVEAKPIPDRTTSTSQSSESASHGTITPRPPALASSAASASLTRSSG